MSVAIQYRNLPIKYKLRMVTMLTVIAALILACTAVLVYDQLTARESMRNGRRERRTDSPAWRRAQSITT